MEMILSIAVVTMNRAEQLKEALNSCLACKLPKETEFIIIDNASSDNTNEVVKTVLDNSGFSYYYEKMAENLGVGAGRNYAFEKASGEYFYSLDDDAVISENNKNFFLDAIETFNNNPDIITLTTQIYDEAWGKNRVEKGGKKVSDNCHKCLVFCGGSHFLRKAFFSDVPYIANKYGYEELLPSFKVYDSGKINVFCDNLLVVHKPKVNKWDYTDEKNHELLAKDCSLPYAIKKMMYPRLFRLILFFGYKVRCKKYLSKIKGGKRRANQIVKETVKNYHVDYKMRGKSVIKMYKEFGKSVF